MLSNRQQIVVDQVQDYLVHRAAQHPRRLVRIDLAEICTPLERRYPADPRPQVAEIREALRTLRARGMLRPIGPTLAEVRIDPARGMPGADIVYPTPSGATKLCIRNAP